MTQATFRTHRERFLATLEREKAAAVIPAGNPPRRNADSQYRFRPESDFYYLTGFAEESSVLVLVPHAEEARTVLFLRERDPKAEIWNGRRLGVEAAPEALGVDRAYPVSELAAKLPELLKGTAKLVYAFGIDEDFDRRVVRAVQAARRGGRGVVAPEQWIEPSVWLHEQRLRKTPGEIEIMRQAVAITTEAHTAAMGEVRPGRSEAEIDALLGHAFRRLGGTGEAYPNIVAGGANACILHYVENDRILESGSLVLIDAAAEFGFYASDVTRTLPVNGRFSPEQRALYEIVLAAEEAAIAAVAPRATIGGLHEIAVRRIVEGLVSLGLLAGPVDKAIQEESYQRFYMHRTSHWLGLDVHDCGAYRQNGRERFVEPGMVFTVEPGIYVAADDPTVDARWRGIGIRIEDDLLVTAEGHEVLTRAIPKKIADVEAACAG
ncbi:MAG: aminopeptidase P N-terminal domain-containing protein [Planctomycetota bacterium]